MPDAEGLVVLIRRALLSLNDGLLTGNFTVLRDLGSPKFKEANTAHRLGQVFAPIAAQGVDLSAVAIIAPQISQLSSIDEANSAFRVAGFFPGTPVRIDFKLGFALVGGRWLIEEIGVLPVLVPVEPNNVSGATKSR